MKELNNKQMEGIKGGDVEGILCGLAFDQLGFWNGLALGLAGVSLGVSLGVGLAIGVAGTIACELMT